MRKAADQKVETGNKCDTMGHCIHCIQRRRFTEESSEDVSEDVREAMTESQAILSALGEITHIQIGKLLKVMILHPTAMHK